MSAIKLAPSASSWSVNDDLGHRAPNLPQIGIWYPTEAVSHGGDRGTCQADCCGLRGGVGHWWAYPTTPVDRQPHRRAHHRSCESRMMESFFWWKPWLIWGLVDRCWTDVGNCSFLLFRSWTFAFDRSYFSVRKASLPPTTPTTNNANNSNANNANNTVIITGFDYRIPRHHRAVVADGREKDPVFGWREEWWVHTRKELFSAYEPCWIRCTSLYDRLRNYPMWKLHESRYVCIWIGMAAAKKKQCGIVVADNPQRLFVKPPRFGLDVDFTWERNTFPLGMHNVCRDTGSNYQ